MITKAFAAIAFLAMVLITVSFGALAEEAEEPEVGDVEELEALDNVTFMFVQTAASGTLVPVDGVENLYTLTFVGVAPQTIAFSDRPERIIVQAPMQEFLDGFCWLPENPPNAALEILEADEEEDLAVVELFDPVYDNVSQTLQYNVSILEEPNHSYAIFNERHDVALPESFGAASLFIDDCADSFVGCCKDKWCLGNNFCGYIHGVSMCWSWDRFACYPCTDQTSRCKEKFGQDCWYWY